jgi:hypothetical protein
MGEAGGGNIPPSTLDDLSGSDQETQSEVTPGGDAS